MNSYERYVGMIRGEPVERAVEVGEQVRLLRDRRKGRGHGIRSRPVLFRRE